MNESDLPDETHDSTEMSYEEMIATMKANFIENAQYPWKWEWKYTMAFDMLSHGRPIDFVKNVLGLTYPWLRKYKLIEMTPFGWHKPTMLQV